MNGEALLTTQEVADRLGISPRTVEDWARTGRIPSVKVGRATRYYWSRIEAWLEQGSRGPAVVSSLLDRGGDWEHPGHVSDERGGNAGEAKG